MKGRAQVGRLTRGWAVNDRAGHYVPVLAVSDESIYEDATGNLWTLLSQPHVWVALNSVCLMDLRCYKMMLWLS